MLFLRAGVWHGEALTEVREGADGAGDDALIAAFEAVQELHCGRVADGRVEAACLEVLVIGVLIPFQFEIHGLRLQFPAARETPGGRDHLLDDGEFDTVAGFKALDEVLGEFLEDIGVLGLQHDDLGEDAVFDCVLGRFGFAFGGFGPARLATVDARGFGFGQGHGCSW